MKFCVASDLHGNLVDVPDCDALLLCGDYCPYSEHQQWWFRDEFAPWLSKLSKRMKVFGVAGNHDLIFQKYPELLPKLDWTYLEDSGTEWNGLKIWGSPWQPRFYDWAFNASEDELKEKWKLIPDDTDILLLHGPPRGYGDFSPIGQEHTGSVSLLERIQIVQPKLVCAGHIHFSRGIYKIPMMVPERVDEVIFINAAVVDENYHLSNEIIILDF